MVLVWTRLWTVHERRWATGETGKPLFILLPTLHGTFHRQQQDDCPGFS
jgi:hypothetical protein